MNKVEGYGAYQSRYYDNQLVTRNSKEASKTNETSKTENKNPAPLSDKAKELLEELKKTYKNMDFMVANYDTEEEAMDYHARGTKDYSVLIEPELLEKMAADEQTKEKYLGIINNATQKIGEIKDQLGEEKEEVTRIGFTVGTDGSVSYFAELEKMSEKQKDRIEKTKEEKAEKTAQEKAKKTRVQADSIEELIEKIKNVDWDKVKITETKEIGGKFDSKI